MERDTLGNLGAALFLVGALAIVGTLSYAFLNPNRPPSLDSVGGWIAIGISVAAVVTVYVGGVLARYSKTGNLGRVILETTIGFGIVMAVILWRVLQRR